MAGCTAADPNAPPPVFGGQGATLEAPKEQPLPPAAPEVARNAGPCGQRAPVGDGTLIDDFEDGDEKPFKAFQREAWWFTAVDDSAGGSVHPPAGSFKPDRLPDGKPENQFAAHLSARGYSAWGVVWGATLHWVERGVKCPFNASAFSGIRFRAKGPAAFAVKFNMPDVVPKQDGGTCTSGCYDAHGKVVFLKDGWQEVIVPFDRVQQGGWGVDVRFDPSRIVNINFSADPKQQPIDFWIDDIEFVKGPAPPARPAATPSPG